MRFSKVPKTFRARKAIVIFEHVFDTSENETIANFHDWKRFPFEGTKSFVSPEMTPEKFRDFRETPP